MLKGDFYKQFTSTSTKLLENCTSNENVTSEVGPTPKAKTAVSSGAGVG